MYNLKPIFTLAVICSLFIPSVAFSWQVEHWPYDRLFKEADLVMFGTVDTGFAAEEEWAEKIFDKDRFEGMKTAFGASFALKGSPPISTWVVHFKYKKGVVRYNDGPDLVTFLKEPVLIELKSTENKKGKLQSRRKGLRKISQPEYLLFLKERKDGMYEPISGQLDANFSVRALLPADNISIR